MQTSTKYLFKHKIRDVRSAMRMRCVVVVSSCHDNDAHDTHTHMSIVPPHMHVYMGGDVCRMVHMYAAWCSRARDPKCVARARNVVRAFIHRKLSFRAVTTHT